MVFKQFKDAWKTLIKKNDYQTSYNTCKSSKSPYLPYVAGVMGDLMISQKKYLDASNYYLESNRSFEEVFL